MKTIERNVLATYLNQNSNEITECMKQNIDESLFTGIRMQIIADIKAFFYECNEADGIKALIFNKANELGVNSNYYDELCQIMCYMGLISKDGLTLLLERLRVEKIKRELKNELK